MSAPRRRPEPTSPLFEERGLFADVETLETTPLEELELPRELAPGVIAYPTPAEEIPLKVEPTPADNSPEAVAARRQMFAGFGWTTTKET